MRSKAWVLLTIGLLLTAAPFSTTVRAQDGAAPPAAETEAEKKLLEVGKVSPDFTLPLIGGGDVTLSNLFKNNKAVLVGFWSIDDERGGLHMEHIQKLHDKLEAKGLAIVAINPAEETQEVARFVRTEKLLFQVAIDGKETNRAVTGVYKARTLPTYYLIDHEGKVTWRAIGWKEEPLKAAIEKLGVK